MLPFSEQLQEATILKRFLDEFEKNPKRTIGALIAVVCLTGAGAKAVLGDPSPPFKNLSELPSSEPKTTPEGVLERLPEPKSAEEALTHTLSRNEHGTEWYWRRFVRDQMMQNSPSAILLY